MVTHADRANPPELPYHCLSVAAETPKTGPRAAYRIAGCHITVDQPLSSLDAFLEEPTANSAAPTFSPVETWHCATRGLVGNHIRTVNCQSGGNHQNVTIENVGQFTISTAGQVQYPNPLNPAFLTEALCGPLLPLAMTWQDIFCLHGSAVMGAGGLTLFLGVSGAGKSTLASALSGQGFERWADDTIAVDAHEIGLCRGHYPQPKWHNWRPSTPRNVAPLRQIIFLNPGADSPCILTPTPPPTATLALIEHTLAGRLFAPSMLRRQLRFAAALADKVPCSTLYYRQELASLTPMINAIRALGAPS
ncbi:MAG: hypothetical protein AB8B96_03335 [Lysobacterales bacterium]